MKTNEENKKCTEINEREKNRKKFIQKSNILYIFEMWEKKMYFI